MTNSISSMTDKYKGQLITLKFEYTDEIVEYCGYLIDFNKDWILLKHNRVDYVVDGYIVLKNKFVTHFKRDARERFKQKVLDLKGEKPGKFEIIPIKDLATILNHLTKQYGLFQFNMRTNKTCWLGKVRRISGSDLMIDYLTPKATWTKTMLPYKLGNIRSVEFDTDYNNSLKLIAERR